MYLTSYVVCNYYIHKPILKFCLTEEWAMFKVMLNLCFTSHYATKLYYYPLLTLLLNLDLSLFKIENTSIINR